MALGDTKTIEPAKLVIMRDCEDGTLRFLSPAGDWVAEPAQAHTDSGNGAEERLRRVAQLLGFPGCRIGVFGFSGEPLESGEPVKAPLIVADEIHEEGG